MLTSKQRAFLRAKANNLDTILIIGKGGVTPDIIKQADNAIKKRELIKGRTLETAPKTTRDTADDIAAQINADVVQVIGSRFVLFRQNEDEPVIALP